MKTNKPKVQKKLAKKAGKKELVKTLTEKFLELMKELGQDAEKIGVDIKKVGSTAVKKLSAKFSIDAAAKKGIINHVKPNKKANANDKIVTKKAAVNDVKPNKKSAAVKAEKKIEKVVKRAVTKAIPVAQSVKVVPIVTEEKVANAIAKKPVAKKPVRATRKPKTEKDTTPNT
jgi:hypothetical protein